MSQSTCHFQEKKKEIINETLETKDLSHEYLDYRTSLNVTIRARAFIYDAQGSKGLFTGVRVNFSMTSEVALIIDPDKEVDNDQTPFERPCARGTACGPSLLVRVRVLLQAP